MRSSLEIVTSLSLFRFMTNLPLSGSGVPDAWSIEFIFSLTTTFHFTKPENRTKTL